ncbi:DUF1416 domain-containing protein [Nakamurella leprariae]|uniref:DUF1416 domain-containing protein n=1 Tax=Nakamurella leprariae TaxID=2803911 RepID=A0A939C0X9_9ACTN|nr:DUF1416 domain-containing protein [Nakamurella leprariae]MBM9466602.1 DUF1416 domain-containing protein [Nakamurella leprariae]
MAPLTASSCAAPEQTVELPEGTNTTDQAVVQGRVLADAAPVGGAFVRLLDATGEFTAEVVSSPEGVFRFYTAPGTWTVRALSRAGSGQADLAVTTGVFEVDVPVAR